MAVVAAPPAQTAASVSSSSNNNNNNNSGKTALHHAYSFSYMRRSKANTTAVPNLATTNAATSGTAATASNPVATTVTAAAAPSTSDMTPESQDATGTAGAGGGGSNPYETSIKVIATVGTVEDFWAVYDFLKRPNDLPSTTDYHFFRAGVKPTWEDPSNARGGKWIVRLPKGLASRYWEEICLALVGQQFIGVPDGEICGAVLSVRYSEDILGVWNRTSQDREVVDRIREAVKKILQLPTGQATMEYKPHQASMADRSSFRPWKPKSSLGSSSHHGSSGGSGSHHTNAVASGDEGGAPPPPARGDARRSNSWAERNELKPSKSRDLSRAWR